jgi:4-hydroxy-tetrahydrodipicolinate synthase
MREKFYGTGVAMVTPFDSQLNIDFDALRRVTEHLVTGGIEFLVPLGTTGESVTLSEEEQLQALETILEVNRGRLPVLVGAGGNNTRAVAEKMRLFARRFSIDGFLSVSPFYNKPTQKGIFEHYKALSQATELPIIVYNVPGRTGSNVLPETVLQLGRDCKTITGVKEASGDLAQGMKIYAGKTSDFSLLSGDDALALPQVASGYDGIISVSGNACPATFSNMVRYALGSEIQAARTLHYNLLEVMQLNFKEGNPAGVKAALAAQQICEPYVRQPLATSSDELQAQLKTALERLQATPA